MTEELHKTGSIKLEKGIGGTKWHIYVCLICIDKVQGLQTDDNLLT